MGEAQQEALVASPKNSSAFNGMLVRIDGIDIPELFIGTHGGDTTVRCIEKKMITATFLYFPLRVYKSPFSYIHTAFVNASNGLRR